MVTVPGARAVPTMPLGRDLRACDGREPPVRGVAHPTRPSLHAPMAMGVGLGMDGGSRLGEGPWRMDAPQKAAIAIHFLKNKKTHFLPRNGLPNTIMLDRAHLNMW